MHGRLVFDFRSLAILLAVTKRRKKLLIFYLELSFVLQLQVEHYSCSHSAFFITCTEIIQPRSVNVTLFTAISTIYIVVIDLNATHGMISWIVGLCLFYIENYAYFIFKNYAFLN